MGDLVSALIALATAIVAVVVIQIWPSKFGWGKVISVQRGRPSGRLLYRVRVGMPPRRQRWRGPAPRTSSRRVRLRRGPIDVNIYARLVIDLRPEVTASAKIPVQKSWRPSIYRGVLTTFVPSHCERDPLRHFPAHIRDKHEDGILSLDDLLSVDGTRLRVYAFGYRPYLGTRLLARAEYEHKDLKAGSYRRGRFVPSVGGEPPEVSDIIDDS